ncbi:hypothetical protein PG991_015466 [Apiospora marii]|uniref:2EXR domain-containing protein n=1 Tax=Apiospora marii TaxID=335849 RepID=A0ABR1R1S0_9PEZI
MSQFHPFPRLPPELRHQIWRMSMVPRELVLYAFNKRPAPPAILHACSESRNHLQQRSKSSSHYVKVFQVYENRAIYLWVNFDLDTIYADPFALEDLPEAELARIQRLTTEGVSPSYFAYNHALTLRWAMPALRDVTILSMDRDRARRDAQKPWWKPWAPLFEMLFYPPEEWDVDPNPASFYLRILRPDDEPPAIGTPDKLNLDNYHNQWRILSDVRTVAPGLWVF